MRKMFEEIKKDEKVYLLLLEFINEDFEQRQAFEFVKSRKATIQSIIDLCQVYRANEYSLDFDESKVIVQGVDITQAQDLRKFINYCVSYKYIEDEELDTLLEYGYSPEEESEDDEDTTVVHVATMNNDRVSNFINDIPKEEV